MSEEMIDCRKIFESIEQDTAELLKFNIVEKMKEDTIKSINDRVDIIHNQLDSKADEFIDLIIKSFNLSNENETADSSLAKSSKPVGSGTKKQIIERNKRLDEIQSLTDQVEKAFQSSMEDLIYSVNQIIDRTAVMETSSKFFQDNELGNIISIGKEEFNFKMKKNLSWLLRGKNNFDIEWDTVKNNASYSKVDNDDNLKLNIFGTTCYTYYQTNAIIADEDVTIEIEYNINTNDNYFYLGFINSSVVPTSNCMCCTISNAVYIQPNGDCVINGSRRNISALNATKGKDHNVILRINASEKEVFFTMDDKDEQGPFKIPGNNFKLVGGSCNSTKGFIRIVNASYS